MGGAWKRDETHHVRRHLASLVPRPSPRPPCMYRTESLGTRLLQSCLPEVWSSEKGISLATTKRRSGTVIEGVLQTCNIISVTQAPTNLLLNVMCNLIGADKSSNENLVFVVKTPTTNSVWE